MAAWKLAPALACGNTGSVFSTLHYYYYLLLYYTVVVTSHSGAETCGTDAVNESPAGSSNH
jgi:hypothetical protein